MKGPCEKSSGLDCTLDNPLTDFNSGALRYDTSHNYKHENIDPQTWKDATSSFQQYVNIAGESAATPGKHYDSKAMADSYYDSQNKLFWTWQSPHAIGQACEALKGVKDLGGQFVFSLGQDRADLGHHEAWKSCVAGW